AARHPDRRDRGHQLRSDGDRLRDSGQRRRHPRRAPDHLARRRRRQRGAGHARERGRLRWGAGGRGGDGQRRGGGLLMAADAKSVMELRERTGAGVMDCKAALTASNGNLDAAAEYLRKKGLADAKKREGREAKEGIVHAYLHPDGKLGALIEVNCETDFVAKTDAFRELVRDLAMQVAATNPAYVAREDVPAAVLEK